MSSISRRCADRKLFRRTRRRARPGCPAFHAERAPHVATAENSNRVKHDVRFFQDSPQFIERVTRVIVLSIADQQQRALRMGAALHALDAEIAGIVERGVVLRLHEGQLIEHRVSIARPIHQQLRARIEANQEIFVPIVAGLDEMRQRVARPSHLVAAHRAGNVKQDADGNRRIVIAEEGDLLLGFFIENAERILAQARNETPVDIRYRYLEGDQIGVGDDGILIVDAALRSRILVDGCCDLSGGVCEAGGLTVRRSFCSVFWSDFCSVFLVSFSPGFGCCAVDVRIAMVAAMIAMEESSINHAARRNDLIGLPPLRAKQMGDGPESRESKLVGWASTGIHRRSKRFRLH